MPIYYPQTMNPDVILSYTGVEYEWPLPASKGITIINVLADYEVLHFMPDGVIVIFKSLESST